jgi:hypothetical protein
MTDSDLFTSVFIVYSHRTHDFSVTCRSTYDISEIYLHSLRVPWDGSAQELTGRNTAYDSFRRAGWRPVSARIASETAGRERGIQEVEFRVDRPVNGHQDNPDQLTTPRELGKRNEDEPCRCNPDRGPEGTSSRIELWCAGYRRSSPFETQGYAAV